MGGYNMGKREELLKECRELGITFVDDSFSLNEIREAIENKKKEIAAAEKKRQSTETWKEAVAPEQEELLQMLESRGLDPERIQKWLSYSTSAGSQEELHHAINEDIRARNACRERHGLSKREKLMPLRRDIVDLYSHGLMDEWLNEPKLHDPNYKVNFPFERYASGIIEDLQKKEREVQKAEAVKAEVQTRFARLKVIPTKIITDPQSGKVRANEKYNQWIDEASELRHFLENQIKVYASGGKEASAVPDVEKTLKSTYQLLLPLIENAKKQ
jgi:uncharacterized membrane-anchored protein YjiN (DUF445 family)